MKKLVIISFLLILPVLALAAPPEDALSMMSVVFKGEHSRAEIKVRLDEAMTLYKTPITEDNYSRAGSALVALRKETGVHEMKVLDYMIRSHVPGINITFAVAAALSASFLQAGDQ